MEKFMFCQKIDIANAYFNFNCYTGKPSRPSRTVLLLYCEWDLGSSRGKILMVVFTLIQYFRKIFEGTKLFVRWPIYTSRWRSFAYFNFYWSEQTLLLLYCEWDPGSQHGKIEGCFCTNTAIVQVFHRVF